MNNNYDVVLKAQEIIAESIKRRAQATQSRPHTLNVLPPRSKKPQALPVVPLIVLAAAVTILCIINITFLIGI